MKAHGVLNWLNSQGYVIALATERTRTSCPVFWYRDCPYYRPHHAEVLNLLRDVDGYIATKFYHEADRAPESLASFLRNAPARWWMGLNRYRPHILVLAKADPFGVHPRLPLLNWLLEYAPCP